MAISKITTRGFNFANTLSRGDFTDASFGDIILLENELGALLMDASADGVDVEGHILYNNNESAEFFSNISTSQLSDDAVTAAKIADNTITADNINFALNEDNIILNATDGSSTDEGSFLLLDSSAASTDEGEKIIYDSIFNPATLNVNEAFAAGKALKVPSSGAGFELATAGTHQLLETTIITTNTGNVTFLDMNTRGFNVYMFEVECMQPQTDNVKPSLVVAGADGAIDTGSIYNYCAKGHTSSASDIDNGNNTAVAYRIFGDSVQTGNETDEGCSFRMYMYNAADSVKFTQFHCQGISVGSNYCVAMTSACNVYEAGHVTTAVRFLFNSDNIATGTFKLYGVS